MAIEKEEVDALMEAIVLPINEIVARLKVLEQKAGIVAPVAAWRNKDLEEQLLAELEGLEK